MVVGLATQRAATCDHAALPPVYFLLTSTPDRSERVPLLISTLRNQTLVPTRVILTVATRYNPSRFKSPTFVLPPELVRDSSLNDWLTVHQLGDDKGPLSKYFGVGSIADKDDPSGKAAPIAVVGDDDVFYGKTFVEDYACAVAAAPLDTIFSSGIDLDCGYLRGCVMGFKGVAMRAALLRRLSSYSSWPHACFTADDVIITYYLIKCNSYRIRRLKLRSRIKLDNAFAWSNSSINAFHRERHFQVNKGCTSALRSASQRALCGPGGGGAR